MLSVLVLRGVVFVSGFDTVVSVTEALPVALIPEQYAVTSVRFDVIDIGRLDITPLLHALHTQRMRLKVTLAGFVPCCTIASAACGASVLRVEGTVLVTVLGTVGNERCTAGMSAWCLWSAWHCLCLLSTVVFHSDRGGQLRSAFAIGVEQRPSYIVVGETKMAGRFQKYLKNFLEALTAPTEATIFRSVHMRKRRYSPHREVPDRQ